MNNSRAEPARPEWAAESPTIFPISNELWERLKRLDPQCTFSLRRTKPYADRWSTAHRTWQVTIRPERCKLWEGVFAEHPRLVEALNTAVTESEKRGLVALTRPPIVGAGPTHRSRERWCPWGGREGRSAMPFQREHAKWTLFVGGPFDGSRDLAYAVRGKVVRYRESQTAETRTPHEYLLTSEHRIVAEAGWRFTCRVAVFVGTLPDEPVGSHSQGLLQ